MTKKLFSLGQRFIALVAIVAILASPVPLASAEDVTSTLTAVETQPNVEAGTDDENTSYSTTIANVEAEAAVSSVTKIAGASISNAGDVVSFKTTIGSQAFDIDVSASSDLSNLASAMQSGIRSISGFEAVTVAVDSNTDLLITDDQGRGITEADTKLITIEAVAAVTEETTGTISEIAAGNTSTPVSSVTKIAGASISSAGDVVSFKTTIGSQAFDIDVSASSDLSNLASAMQSGIRSISGFEAVTVAVDSNTDLLITDDQGRGITEADTKLITIEAVAAVTEETTGTISTTAAGSEAVAAVAQVDTLTVTQGTAESGDVYTVTVNDGNNNFTATYTTDGFEDNSDDIASAIADAVNDETGGIYFPVIADATGSSSGQLTLTADIGGTGFTTTFSVTNRAAVAQVVTITPADVTAGENFIVTINGTPYSYLADDGDGVAEVVTGLVNAINDTEVPAAANTDNAYLTLTANTPGTPFTYSTEVVTGETFTITIEPGWSVFSTPRTISNIAFSTDNVNFSTSIDNITFYTLTETDWDSVTATASEITPTEGYLIDNDTDNTIYIRLVYASETTEIFYTNPLHHGWNLIGTTDEEQPLQDLIITNNDYANNLIILDLTGGAGDNSLATTFTSYIGDSNLIYGTQGQAFAAFIYGDDSHYTGWPSEQTQN